MDMIGHDHKMIERIALTIEVSQSIPNYPRAG